jgi:hypothetical protein
MRFVKAQPNEYLVIGRGGRIVNRGVAASAFLWLGSSHVLIASTQQEAAFEMTQETKDSISLRFKGTAIYHIADPELAARQFNFADGSGNDQIKTLMTHVALGELRATVAHLTMEECIAQRKTTLTNAVTAALQHAIKGDETRPGWGIALDVVQVGQVFVVDPSLRQQLEAEVRNAIKSKSQLSEIRTREGIQLAEAASARRLQQEHLESERGKAAIAQEQLRLRTEYEHAEVEAAHPLQLLKAAKQMEMLQSEQELRTMEVRTQALKVEAELLPERARQELRKEVLPLEQAPAIAQAFAGMFRGLNVSVYGQDAGLLTAVVPIIDLLTHRLREAMPVSPPRVP